MQTLNKIIRDEIDLKNRQTILPILIESGFDKSSNFHLFFYFSLFSIPY